MNVFSFITHIALNGAFQSGGVNSMGHPFCAILKKKTARNRRKNILKAIRLYIS